MKYYAGIGSRRTPPDILTLMTEIAHLCELNNIVLRSGGAPGADLAFEYGTQLKEIFLPWKGFNGNNSLLYHDNPAAFELASTVHPAWFRLSIPVRKLISRNMCQVLGADLDSPVSFVVCYTPDGAENEKECSKATGGTGTAIILASRIEIPVFNLQHGTDRVDDVLEFICSL